MSQGLLNKGSLKNLVLFAAVLLTAASCNFVGSSGTQGVIKSLDAGGNWQTADAVAGSNSATITGLTVAEMGFDPQNRQNIYVGAVNSGLWKSTDAAKSWKEILTNLAVLDFFIDPADNNTIYASGTFNNHGRIVKTADGGKTWTEQYVEASANNPVDSISANPTNPGELYAGLNSGVLLKSNDGGTNWFVVFDFNHSINPAPGSLPNFLPDQILKVRYNPVNRVLYVLLHNGGVAESTDGGVHWNFITTALTSETISNIVVFQPRRVDAFVKMALDDQSAGVIYLTTSNGLYKTSDDGKNWAFLNVPVQAADQLPRAVTSSQGGMLAYVSIGSTIFKSTDGGQSWETEDLPTNHSVNRIIVDPQLPQIVYAGLVP